MQAEQARKLLRASMSETEFQGAVAQLAGYHGWTVNHHRKTLSGRNGGWVTGTTLKGWPDLCFMRPPDMFFAELKTERGTLSKEQVATIALLRDCGQTVYVWKPRDWDVIEGRLR